MKKIIEKINDLYIIKRKQYLIMFPTGKYITFDVDKGAKYLTDFTVQRHLEGKATLGVFCTRRASKFICFDVDVKDKHKAHWTTLKVLYSLIELGVPQGRIYISHSGNKGYHVEVFFSEPIENYILKEFYYKVLENADLLDMEDGDVELRPTATQGVKLPLGRHFNTPDNKRCVFVEHDRLKPITFNPMKSILSIEKMDSSIIYDILERENDMLLEEDVKAIEETEDYIEKKYTPLTIYQQNEDEQETVESIELLLLEGLKMQGTRNNSLFKLAKYFKWQGLNQKKVKQELINWMEWQDKKTYTTKWEDCLKEIEHISSYVFEKDVQLTVKRKEIIITYGEMKQIIDNCKSKNEKLVAYCMLIHSKRYSNKSGVFYMTFEQLAESTGLGIATAKRIVPKLAELGIVEVVDSNRKQKGTHIKKPNVYKLHIEQMNDDSIYTVNNEMNESESFSDCLTYLFTTKELKSLLPRRQYESVVG